MSTLDKTDLIDIPDKNIITKKHTEHVENQIIEKKLPKEITRENSTDNDEGQKRVSINEKLYKEIPMTDSITAENFGIKFTDTSQNKDPNTTELTAIPEKRGKYSVKKDQRLERILGKNSIIKIRKIKANITQKSNLDDLATIASSGRSEIETMEEFEKNIGIQLEIEPESVEDKTHI
ncbi:hypothetical protein AYI69_g747 [Smittium culicis]|uniref:Uncharacterized protein n=1 Tax=Smittium culicis TaxID=133412 RepID=A0A1R1YS82_9FUNG|nr:hypothetical protein AYI69_g747 [Smittium culicis]